MATEAKDQAKVEPDDEELPLSDEYDDDMKISRAVSKANSDEEMIQTEDIRAGVEDPGSEETKTVKMKKTPKQPSQREREEHERTHLSEIGARTVSRPNPATTHTRERPT